MDAHEKLHRFLVLKGLTQEAFAERYKVSQASVSSWLGPYKRPGRGMALLLQRIAGIPVGAWDSVKLKPRVRREGKAA